MTFQVVPTSVELNRDHSIGVAEFGSGSVKLIIKQTH